MGSGWSEEQAAQPPQQPATVGAAIRNNEHSSGNSSNNNLKEEKEKVVKGKLGEEVKLGHGFEAILKDADLPVDRSSLDKLYDQLYAGIFLNKRTKASVTLEMIFTFTSIIMKFECFCYLKRKILWIYLRLRSSLTN